MSCIDQQFLTIRGNAPEVHFTVNNNDYNMGYYLADDIYPPWATLISGYSSLKRTKKDTFQNNNQGIERTSKVHLVSFKQNIQS
jgi:hypothetical protein